MLNGSNLCIFEGRMVKDPEFESVGKGKNAFTKARFTLAIDRKLTKDQRDAKKNGDDIKTADFPRFVALGGSADGIQSCFDSGYLGKGKPIRVVCSFEDFSWEDKNGDTQYGNDFRIEEWGFTTQEAQGNGGGKGGNGNSNNGGSRNTNSRSNNNNNNSNKRGKVAADEDTYEVDDEDIPF